MTNSSEEFRKFADECERMAAEITGQREALLEIARGWRRAAQEHEAAEKKAGR